MKALALATPLIAAAALAAPVPAPLHAQSESDARVAAQLVALSATKFRWQLQHQVDSLAALLDDRFVALHSNGLVRSKPEYVEDVRSGRPVYDSITVHPPTVRVAGNTAVLVSRGRFVITMGGAQTPYDLAYMEVYRRDARSGGRWKLLARQTTPITQR